MWKKDANGQKRLVLRVDGIPYVFKSNHPLEERIVAVTDDLPLPPVEPWDGVQTCPGIVLKGLK